MSEGFSTAGSYLDRAYQEASKCNRCGFCQTACPVYQVTRKEGSTARGHSYQVRSLVEGRLPVSDSLRQTFEECLQCRACVDQCSPRVQTNEVVAEARRALGAPGPRAKLLPAFLRKALLNPRRLGEYARLAATAHSLGISRIAALGGPGLSRSHDLLPQLPGRSLYDRTRGRVLEPRSPKGRVAYFAGCGMNYLLPKAGEATIDIILASGFSVAVTRNYCCGLLSQTLGDPDTALRLARGNLRLLNAQDVDAIVTDCASCSSFLKGYAGLLKDSAAFAESAGQFAAKVLDITEFLARLDPAPKPGGLAIKVTYHDPCHASRYQGLKKEPRSALQSIPGLELIEMEEADWCCGGAGSYSVTHPELSQRILDRKMENAARTGAEVLVTSCPACMLQLSFGVRRHGLPMRVLHLSQVMRMAQPRGH
ncbi:MAG: (Fe-S)-binding protein [Dehalococcoidia bacterium]|nr:(Fe-S)-binding protein [Dehalococcoidia bacterium]